MALLPGLVLAVALPSQVQASPASTPPEHVAPVPHVGPSGHRVHLSDQLLSGAKLAAAIRSGAAKAASSGVSPAASGQGRAGVAPFLTRPYWNHHDVTSIFDHCNPDYSIDGRLCEVDGTVATSSNGVDPTFPSGYALSPGSGNYLYYDGHNGWDIALNYEPLIAAAPGTVTIAGVDPNNPGFGLCVVIDHGNGFSTRYGHMSQISVQVGQHVNRAQPIGISGNTGNSSGPHLHFGLYTNNPWTAIDPWGWAGNGADPWPADSGDLWITGNPQNPTLQAPNNVHATTLGNSAVVTWSAPTFDGGDPITSYTVTASPGTARATVDGNTYSAMVTGLSYGTQYTFTVTAVNDLGSASAGSNAVKTSAISLGGAPAGNPAVVSWASDHLDVFEVGSDHSVWHRTLDSTGWRPWESLGGAATSDVEAVSWGPNRMDVFVKGSDNAVWHRSWNGAWSPWQSLGGQLVGNPSVSSWSANRLDVLVRGTDNAVWHTAWDGATWHRWESLGGNILASPIGATASANHLDVFVHGADNGIWQRTWTGTRWAGWLALGGSLGSEPNIVARPGLFDIFVRGTDNTLQHRQFNGSWHAWESLGGLITAAPSASGNGSDLIVTAVGTDGGLWERSTTGSGWGAWTAAGGAWTRGLAVLQRKPRQADVIGVGPDSALWTVQLTF